MVFASISRRCMTTNWLILAYGELFLCKSYDDTHPCAPKHVQSNSTRLVRWLTHLGPMHSNVPLGFLGCMG